MKQFILLSLLSVLGLSAATITGNVHQLAGRNLSGSLSTTLQLQNCGTNATFFSMPVGESGDVTASIPNTLFNECTSPQLRLKIYENNLAVYTGTFSFSSDGVNLSRTSTSSSPKYAHTINEIEGLRSALENVGGNGSIGSEVSDHLQNVNNPHNVTKTQIGLPNVPNVDATSRANHTGTQLASTISNFASAGNALWQSLNSNLTSISGKTLVGNGSNLRFSNGSFIQGNAITIDASGNFIDSGSALIHVHTQSDVTGLVSALSGKEPANANIQAHIISTSNPHSVTASQVGLGSVTNNAQLKISSNLADLASASTARTNLGVPAAPTGSANAPLFNDGSGGFTNGTRSGNTTALVTTTGTQTSGRCVEIDANGNHIAAAAACGTGGGVSVNSFTIPAGQATIPYTHNLSLSAPYVPPGMTCATDIVMTVSQIVDSSNTATVTTSSPLPAGVQSGSRVKIAGVTGDTDLNGTYVITITGASTFTYTSANVTDATYNNVGITATLTVKVEPADYSGSTPSTVVVSLSGNAATDTVCTIGNVGTGGNVTSSGNNSFTGNNSFSKPINIASSTSGTVNGDARVSGGRLWIFDGTAEFQQQRQITPVAPLNFNADDLSIPQATSSASGYLATSDWVVFNSKLTSPLTTKGDMLVHSGSTHARLGVGTDGYCWIADSAQTYGVKWAACPGAGAGSGTVTHTGTLTLDLPVLGNGTTEIKSVSASTFRTAAGLVIGTNIQAYNAGLAEIAGLSCIDGKIPKKASGVWTCADDATGGGGGSLTDGDYGDVVVSGGGTAINVDDDSGTQKVEVSVDGTLVGARKRINLVPSASVTCSASDDPGSNEIDVTCTSAGSSGAPTTAPYLTATADAGLSSEVNLGALTTGLLKITVSGGTATPSTASAADLPSHASRHQNGGADEIATATPGANVIPKAGGSGTLASGFIPDLSATYATAAKGVTNGDSHDHNGGDGAQINHTTLSNIGTNTHAQIDTFIASKGGASGLAPLDSGSKVPATNTQDALRVGGFGATFPSAAVGNKEYVVVPYACTITGWSVLAIGGTSPTATVDVWKIATGTALPTVSNTITASAKPALSTGAVLTSTTLTGWTTSIAAYDIVGINVDAVSGSPTALKVQVYCQK